uniref:Uncharacterized protein n=1 Tax=Rhizophora mucronata TaxID=61149 RepID=A0A2P2JW54_RHIMU
MDSDTFLFESCNSQHWLLYCLCWENLITVFLDIDWFLFFQVGFLYWLKTIIFSPFFL